MPLAAGLPNRGRDPAIADCFGGELVTHDTLAEAYSSSSTVNRTQHFFAGSRGQQEQPIGNPYNDPVGFELVVANVDEGKAMIRVVNQPASRGGSGDIAAAAHRSVGKIKLHPHLASREEQGCLTGMRSMGRKGPAH